MNDYFFIIADYLKGHKVYPVIRRLLNLLFSASITSFLFERFYFRYGWMNITDYKSILDFFIKGHFFIPFSIFLVIHYLSGWIALATFHLSTSKVSSRLVAKILTFRIRKEDIDPFSSLVSKNPAVHIPIKLTEDVWIRLYKNIKESIPGSQWKKAERLVAKQKREVEESFILCIRALIAISVYFATIKYFGLILFTAVILLLLTLLFSLLVAHLLLEVTPVFIRQFHREAERYIQAMEGSSEKHEFQPE